MRQKSNTTAPKVHVSDSIASDIISFSRTFYPSFIFSYLHYRIAYGLLQRDADHDLVLRVLRLLD